jgi:hypothetical protein
MNNIIRNFLAVIAGLVIGSVVNMGFIVLGPMIIPPPNGADITTEAGLKATLHLFEPKNFIFPFLAHALGTLVGAMIAILISKDRKPLLAYIVSVFFLAAGIMNVMILPSPLWFNVVDLVFAYIPMAFISIILIKRKN